MSSFTLAFMAIALLSCCQAAHFSTSSPDDGDILNVCVGDTLVLPWNLLLTTGDVIEDIKWYFTDRTNNKELIAVSVNDVFLPVPAYSGQLTNVNKTALILNNVTKENAGNFSVHTVIADKSGTVVVSERSVHVDIGDGLQTSDGKMRVTFEPKAVQDSTGQWAVNLYCGNFTYLSSPPFHVQWQLPSGSTAEGTQYSHGHFQLELSSPVRGGNYSCRIPRESSASACLNGVETKGEATLNVDSFEVRLILLEAHQAALQKENDVIKMENSKLKANLSTQQRVFDSKLNQQQANLTRQQASISQLEEKSARHVSFHARGLQDRTPNNYDTLIFPTVRTNQGGAYSNNTGVFTAPFAGTYFFAAQTGSTTKDQTADFYLMVEQTDVSYGKTTSPGSFGETTSIQALISLQKGNRVRVEAFTRSQDMTFAYGTRATFTGFLLYSD